MAERKRQFVTDELVEAALQLLAQRGFHAVTVDDIVAAAGVSRRTFFRYFASKEDVVVQFLAGMGAAIVEALAARPVDEPPSVALRHAAWVPVAACADHSDRALPVVRLIMQTPALRARYLERQTQWRVGLAAELATRLGLDPESDLYPTLAAGMTLTAIDAVLQRWQAGDEKDRLADLTERAMAIIAPALDAPVTPADRRRTPPTVRIRGE
ncbi:TetR family transcriptional regulator [Micromonospora sp. NPDC050495]|uniref:TetR family transcriptional regulator n=1 Tax=Micromonospora sp. NPDC050495 TaxID=3154936 RepID=UPI0033E4666F